MTRSRTPMVGQFSTPIDKQRMLLNVNKLRITHLILNAVKLCSIWLHGVLFWCGLSYVGGLAPTACPKTPYLNTFKINHVISIDKVVIVILRTTNSTAVV